MGTSYIGVGGIGIKITKGIVQKFIDNGHFTQEEWNGDFDECLYKIDLEYKRSGNFYCGERGPIYVFVPGNNLKEINENAEQFIENFKKFGVEISIEDLKVVSDYLIY